MKHTAFWLVGIVVALAVGMVIGGYVVADRAASMFMNNAVDADTRAVRVYVDVLGRLRAGDTEDSAEILESWLDDVLVVVMDPSSYEYGVSDITLARADSAFLEAQAYREAYPRTSDRSFVDEMVANVWDLGPPGQRP